MGPYNDAMAWRRHLGLKMFQFLFCFGTGSYSEVKPSREFMSILLAQPSACRDYRFMHRHLLSGVALAQDPREGCGLSS